METEMESGGFLSLLGDPTQTSSDAQTPGTQSQLTFEDYAALFENEDFANLRFDDLDDAHNMNRHDDNPDMDERDAADNDANPHWIPSNIESLMDQAANDINPQSNRLSIFGPDVSDDEFETDDPASATATPQGQQMSEKARGKRKAIQEEASSKSKSYSRKDSVGGAFDELALYGVPDNARLGGKRRRKQKEPTETDNLMGQVAHLYAAKEYPQAFKLLHEIIRADQKAAAAWKLLAVLHDELGRPDKALQANFIAAHLDPKDAELWTRLAIISETNNNMTEALYCYSKAISADPTNTHTWFQRSKIYAEQGQLYKAIHGFTAILQVDPHDMRAIARLAVIYISLRESGKAIQLLEAAMEADARDPLPAVLEEDDDDEEDFDIDEEGARKEKGAPVSPGPKRWRVGYKELLTLMDLYVDMREFDKGCIAVEEVVGRIELDVVHGSIYGIEGVYDNVPMEIRVKFGVCKLWLDDHESAKVHFDALIEKPVEEYPQLFLEVVDAYMKKRMFALAVGILEVVIKSDSMNVANVWSKMAYCFQHLGRLDDAVDLYKAAIEVEPREYDWQFQLAEIYEALGEVEKANAIVDEVNDLTRADAADSTSKMPKRRRTASSRAAQQDTPTTSAFQTPIYGDPVPAEYDSEEDMGMQTGPSAPGFFKPRSKPNNVIQDKAVMLAQERLAIAENKEWYNKLLYLGEKINEPVKRADFIRFARKLVTRFQNERLFYPAERSKLYTPRGYRGDEDRMNFYLGLPFSTWFEVFVKYSMALTMDKKDEDAFLALKAALDANVFYHNEALRIQLRMYMIASAMVCGNYGRVVELAKAFCQYRMHDNDMYRLYCAVLNGGPDAVSAFASQICAKHFSRQLRSFEIQLQQNPNSELHKNPILLCLYGHILMCARSYNAAIKFYTDAYKLAPKDPLTNLSLGLGYLHWGMQRRIDDRHKRILQAFTFIYQYEELRGGAESPEAMYNVGRAFHQLGLNHIAVEYYERVLARDDGPHTLWPVREAAYNMALILTASGSNAYAAAILRKHLTF
ncbi:hypothetical protein BC830DRAFT_1121194 [Chytriomyces sp. MP71]|nr:hypothetical protein BC830DRAFT_1121194 [Chytriomyces sp. MP71]